MVVSNDFSLTPIPGEMIHVDVFFDFQMGWFRYCDDKDWQIVSSCRSRQIHRWLEVKQVVRFDFFSNQMAKKKQPFEQLLFWTWGALSCLMSNVG